MLFPPGSPVRVPLIAVTAHEEAASICTLIARAVSDAGRAVGLATRDGVTIDGVPYRGVDPRNPAGPRTILNNPDVELAIVEVDAESIVEHGLGFGQCDIAIILSLSGLQTPFGEPVEIVLLRALDRDGVAIIDGSDPAVAALADGIANPVIVVGLEPDDARLTRLLAKGTRVVITRETAQGSLPGNRLERAGTDAPRDRSS